MRKVITNGGKLACLLFLLNFGMTKAQEEPSNNPDQSVPIDGGASLLAAAGVAYGVKKYRDYRKSAESQEDEI